MEYMKGALREELINQDPFTQFTEWFNEAKRVVLEPESMSLATATLHGVPSIRMVLMKGFDTRGLLFFTNSLSRKGHELSVNPVAAVNFYWKELEKQVTAEGRIVKASHLEADTYFDSRSLEAKLGAWASHQGESLSSRKELMDRFEFYKEKYHGKVVPRPPYWEGYRLIPSRFEFWQGREFRLHDRFAYSLKGHVWICERLSP